MRPLTKLLTPLFMLILAANVASPHDIKLSLEETAQNADLIFVGTVAKQSYRLNDAKTMIFTDVFFREIQVLHSTNRSKQKASSEVLLTYAGGSFGDLKITVGDPPTLLAGRRYLIFMSDDGKTYANPIIGGKQGLYEIIKDSATQDEYVLTAGQRPIVGVDASGLTVGEQRLTSVVNGSAVSAKAQSARADGLYSVAPVAASADESASLAERPAGGSMKQARPLKLGEFADFVTNVSLKSSLEDNAFKRDGLGLYYKRNGDDMETEELSLRTQLPVRIPSDISADATTSQKTATQTSALSPSPITAAGGPVGACGYQNLKIVMEQVPTSFWSYSINNDSMFNWNQFMDIFRFSDSNGTFGNNSNSEFAGFVSDSTLFSTYGFHWDGALGITVIYSVSGTDCSRIVQTDVMWNPAYSWTTDANHALGNNSVILLRPVAQHETGHVWGLQDGIYTETYDYDVATVMQPYRRDVVEDGWGIHRADAYVVRRHYQDQTGILSTRDIGVESYYASNGLRNSTTNASTYSPGQSITLNNVTVENMSYAAVSDLRLRFYLSTDRTITTSDYQLGNYWVWSTFNGETYNVANYTATIPSNIPAGNYYVGAIVTLNGFSNDDFTSNNATSFFSRITVLSGGTPAQMTSPANGATLTSSFVNFTWTSGSGVGNYYLYVGTSPGGNNVFNNFVSGNSQGVAVPITGSDLYVRLWSQIGGAWQFHDYTYRTLDGRARITSPANGATFTSSSVNFTWTSGSGVSNYYLYVGTSPGGNNIFNNFVSNSSQNVVGIPTDGRAIYIRLWSQIGGVWQFNDYSYTSCSSCGGTPAQMTSPANGATLTSSSVNFTWTSGSGVSNYYLYVGTSPGGNNVFNNFVFNGAQNVVVPIGGGDIYVRLWSRIGGVWQFHDYTYRTQDSRARITSPVNGSTFTSSSVNFTWTSGSGVSNYYLYVGTSPGGNNIFNNFVFNGSQNVGGIPTDGRTIFVTLWSNINGVWLYNEYAYQASR